jgi:ABC-2 type transport system ATP-binding protein
VLINGISPYENRIENARNMGVVFGQRTQLWWDLPVIESFKILKEIYRVDEATFQKQMALFNDLINLKPLYSQQVRTLSLGQRMLCDIAASFLHNPRVVFLDEPTIGLDVSVKAKIRKVIKELNSTQKITIILTTHDLGDVEALCRRIIIIDKGAILYDGPIETVNQLFGAFRTLKIQLLGYSDDLFGQLEKKTKARFPGDGSIQFANTEAFWTDIVINQSKVAFLDVLNFVMTQFPVEDLRVQEISMENVVQKIYDGALQ